jgi:hypothetical protein
LFGKGQSKIGSVFALKGRKPGQNFHNFSQKRQTAALNGNLPQ